MLDSPKAMPPLEPAVNDIIDTLDEVDQSTPFNLQLQGSAGKIGLSNDGYLDIDDALSASKKSSVGSTISQSIRYDLELSNTKDHTSGYNSQAASCASPGQSEEPSDDMRHASESGGTNHGKSIDVRACRHRLTRLQQISQTPSKSPRERSSDHRPNLRMTTAIRTLKSTWSKLFCSFSKSLG